MVFLSKKEANRRESVSEGQHNRWLSTQVNLDHSYVNTDQSHGPDSVAAEETVHSGGRQWREGRRLVELGVLADGLSACTSCGMPLHLHHAVGVLNMGLSAMIKVQCSNTRCALINNVATGKRHGRTWDVNTKLATAMMHAGMGGEQTNTFLTSLNMPPVSYNLLQRRMSEAGNAISSVAAESVSESLHEELRLTEEGSGVTVATDGAWQKRGSGKAYDSLSGHCSMIGDMTKKVVSFAVRSKICKVCQVAERQNKVASLHECCRNFEGSAKAMESDMVVEMVSEAEKDGVPISTLVTDDDTTTFSRLAKAGYCITKKSDKNHVRKNFTNSLYQLQKQHKTLTNRVIQYIVKLFSYAVSQSQGIISGLAQRLDAIAKHPFGDHSSCNEDWCAFKTNTNSKFKSLPWGKPLSDTSLQRDLSVLIDRYAKNCSKYANLGSTQANEAFNKMVSTKAPKSLHLSGSANLTYRVAACVGQKNKGHGYVMKVNEKIGLSPGYYTKRRCILQDIQQAKRKAIWTSTVGKLRRLKMKSERHQKAYSKQLREGSTYETEVACMQEQDIVEIPPPAQPLVETDPVPVDKDTPWVFFDLETTGFERDAHICQIGASKQDGSTFSCYVLPKKPLSNAASSVTGLKLSGDHLLHNGKRVDTLSIRESLNAFVSFLGCGKSLLVGHNIKTYDSLVLYNSLHNCAMTAQFNSHVLGFLDTKILFKCHFPGKVCLKQTSLVSTVLGETYDAHDALGDVKSLQRLVNVTCAAESVANVTKSLFSVEYAVSSFERSGRIRMNMPTFGGLAAKRIISENMVRKMAASGLRFQHVVCAFKRNGREGIQTLLSEKVSGVVRVTCSTRIIDAVYNFLSNI